VANIAGLTGVAEVAGLTGVAEVAGLTGVAEVAGLTGVAEPDGSDSPRSDGITSADLPALPVRRRGIAIFLTVAFAFCGAAFALFAVAVAIFSTVAFAFCGAAFDLFAVAVAIFLAVVFAFCAVALALFAAVLALRAVALALRAMAFAAFTITSVISDLLSTIGTDFSHASSNFYMPFYIVLVFTLVSPRGLHGSRGASGRAAAAEPVRRDALPGCLAL